MVMEEPFGIFDDGGNRINPELIPKPSLCVLCRKDDDPEEEMMCLLNRADQQGEGKFQCGGYEVR